MEDLGFKRGVWQRYPSRVLYFVPVLCASNLMFFLFRILGCVLGLRLVLA